MSAEPLLDAHGLARVYDGPAGDVVAVSGVDVVVRRGEFVAVHGRSGSGKTTLLNLLGGLDRPTAGRVVLDGVDLASLAGDELSRFRLDRLGFVFQSFGLLPLLSAAENVEVPLRLRRVPATEREARVAELLDRVGLAGRAAHRPHELSGGEQQRVSIARALANEPQLLIADEPTGQLDSVTGRSIMELIDTLVRQRGMAAVVATHDPAMAEVADRVLEVRDGLLLPA